MGFTEDMNELHRVKLARLANLRRALFTSIATAIALMVVGLILANAFHIHWFAWLPLLGIIVNQSWFWPPSKRWPWSSKTACWPGETE